MFVHTLNNDSLSPFYTTVATLTQAHLPWQRIMFRQAQIATASWNGTYISAHSKPSETPSVQSLNPPETRALNHQFTQITAYRKKSFPQTSNYHIFTHPNVRELHAINHSLKPPVTPSNLSYIHPLKRQETSRYQSLTPTSGNS